LNNTIGPRTTVPLLAALGALVVTAVADAGFTGRGQAAFAAVAGAGTLGALLSDHVGAARAARRPVILVLASLGVLAALSAAWTVGDRTAAVRWGLVVAGYAGFAVIGAVAGSDRRSLVVLMALVAAVCVGEGLTGLLAAAHRELPLAERIGGSWRPGGSLESPAALALLQVCALPVLAHGAGTRSRLASILGAGGLAIAGGTLATSGSRLHLALAAAFAAAALAWPGRAGLRRSDVATAIAFVVGAGVAIDLVVGGYAAPHALGGDTGRIVLTIAIILASAGCWLPLRAVVRGAASSFQRTPSAHRLLPIGIAVLALAALGSVVATRPHHGRGGEPSAGFSHGRTRIWRDAVETALDRPLAGSGALSYPVASARHQSLGTQTRFALQLNLELWAELGFAGLGLSLLLYGTAAHAGWRARRSPAAWLAIPAMVAFLVANLFDWPWHLPLTGAVFGLAVGVVTAQAPAGDG
jgi:hypothetical protein